MKRRILSGRLALGVTALVQALVSCAGKEQALPYSGFRPLGDLTITENPSLWGELNTHDPAIIKDNDYYYVFSTDASLGNLHPLGVQIRRSRDLITWEYRGAAFKDFEKDCAEAIAYAGLKPQNKDGLWAPDIVKVNGKYRLYFSASTFGSSRSCIALAEANNIEGPYHYLGMVLKSNANALREPNAIDPAVVVDASGNQYLSYGSFFGGIFLVPLDEKTGFVELEAVPRRIAGLRHAAVEGSCIVYLKDSGYYYLFLSYGSLSHDYNIRVGRSRDVDGPYLDAQGNDLADLVPGNAGDVGTKLMGGYTFGGNQTPEPAERYKAPGHNSVLVDQRSGGAAFFIVHHVRSYGLPDYWFYMNVRRFFLNRWHWPVASPLRYQGEEPGALSLPEGDYDLVEHRSDSNGESHDSRAFRFRDGAIYAASPENTGEALGTYRTYDGFRMELTLEGRPYDGVALIQYDAHGREVRTFTLMSEDGLCIWGRLGGNGLGSSG
ncbi:MAG: arabinan endo-1,5-alpha-L-arabinosidase [Treponema sp.]|jgi:arabinan endo-1,5-alpha-L-arabinosidase|nr:arabinan endo-1,5-alpha-L-arabinosidase [Treponema sp.]